MKILILPPNLNYTSSYNSTYKTSAFIQTMGSEVKTIFMMVTMANILQVLTSPYQKKTELIIQFDVLDKAPPNQMNSSREELCVNMK